MASLGLVWQVLFKGYQELQKGFHLYQHGEMIILRLIYLSDGPGPEELLKEYKKQDKNKSKPSSLETPTKSSELNHKDTLNINKLEEVFSKNLTENTSQSVISVNSFRDIVEMFYEKKEGMIHSKLYNTVKLVSFKVGEITLNSDSIKDPHFNRTVAKLISKWTGRIWQVHSSNSNVGKSLYEEDLLNQQKQIEKIKEHPDMKILLEIFPKASIHSINEIKEINEEKNKPEEDIKEKEI